MPVVLTDENQLYTLLNKKEDGGVRHHEAKIFLESIIDEVTLKYVKSYNVDLLSIFNIASKSMLYYRQKKYRRYTPDFFLKNAFKGKPVSYFKVSSEGEPHFTGPERIILQIGDNITGKKFLRVKKKLAVGQRKSYSPDLKEIYRFAAPLNNCFILGAIAAGKKDYAFVSRYNAENFNTHIVINGERLSAAQVNYVYEGRRDFIDLTDLDLRSAFIALYGIAKRYFSFTDVFSVDGIFSLSENRTLDEKKRLAANEVFLLFAKPGVNLLNELALLTAAPSYLTPPRLDIGDIGLIKRNYTVYKGFELTGRVLLKLCRHYSGLTAPGEKLYSFSLYSDYYDLLERITGDSPETEELLNKIIDLETKFNS